MRQRRLWFLGGLMIVVVFGAVNVYRLTVLIREMLGYEQAQHYVVLTQNNMELWPTGGYLGSFVEFWLNRGQIKNLKIEAIDVPNGQIKGYVAAPEPIVQYTHAGGTPGWRLRESNWNPDFPEAMKTIEWFFVEGGLKPIDTMIAVNLIPVLDILKVIGPVYLPDYEASITEQNFYQEAQAHSEIGFFDGSTQKRDFLAAAGRNIFRQITEGPKTQLIKLMPVALKNLQTKQIMVATKNVNAASWLKRYGWDGSLGQVSQDYLHVNEANLGINKTNCCVSRLFKDTIRLSEAGAEHQLIMLFENHNPEKPAPPEYWGGGYQAWVRLYVPQGTKVKGIKKEGQPEMEKFTVSDEGNKTVVGFLVVVPGRDKSTYTVEYTAPSPTNNRAYRLLLQKQSGVDIIPWHVAFLKGSKIEERQLHLDRDTTIIF